jgi:hypothetical protein
MHMPMQNLNIHVLPEVEHSQLKCVHAQQVKMISICSTEVIHMLSYNKIQPMKLINIEFKPEGHSTKIHCSYTP